MNEYKIHIVYKDGQPRYQVVILDDNGEWDVIGEYSSAGVAQRLVNALNEVE